MEHFLRGIRPERDRERLKHDSRPLTPEEFSSSDSNSQAGVFPDKKITR